jgi:SAM-dependent methyltransferase
MSGKPFKSIFQDQETEKSRANRTNRQTPEKYQNSQQKQRLKIVKIAPGYDELYGVEQQLKLNFCFEQIENKMPSFFSNVKTVLDVGCGTGISSDFFAKKGFSVTGVDPALKLIEEVHKRGMRIIFDGVFNHMGHNSFAFADVREKQAKSAYKDWFSIKTWDDPTTKKNEFDYEGWFGVKSLPELKEDENGIVDGPRQYIYSATERWMNPMNKGTGYGIDGWRLDVAFCVKHSS